MRHLLGTLAICMVIGGAVWAQPIPTDQPPDRVSNRHATVQTAQAPESSTVHPVGDRPLTVVHLNYGALFDVAKGSSIWEPVGPTGSLIGTKVGAFDALPELERIRRFHPSNEATEELWRWRNGGLNVFSLRNNRYYTRLSVNSPAGMLDRLASWPVLQRIGLTIESDAVQSKANLIGRYYYAVSHDTNANLVCIFFRQTLPIVLGWGWEAHASEPKRGELSGFECQDKSGGNAAEVETELTNRIVNFLEALHD